MPLYLAQHGKSLSKELDPERSLSPIGVSETQKIAQQARDQGLSIDKIYHSGKKRALQTAQLFAETIRPFPMLAQIAGINPMDDVTQVLDSLDTQKHIMLVGHLPFLEKLIAYLVTGNSENTVLMMQNSGIVCMDRLGGSQKWAIKWAMTPQL